MLNRFAAICAFVLITGCSHSPPGSNDQDGGQSSSADAMLSGDSPDASQCPHDGAVTPIDGGTTADDAGVLVDANTGANLDSGVSVDANTGSNPDGGAVVDASDGGTGSAYDGGNSTYPDSSVPECNSNDDCPNGEVCAGGKCVCDGGDGDQLCQSDNKTWVCHYPPGHPENRHNICVGTPAVPAHLAHGDTLGACQ